MIFGLDVSSTKVGYCVFNDKEKQIVESGTWKLNEAKCFEQKAAFLRDEIQMILQKNKVDKIVIEERLMSFKKGRSTINSIIKVANMNAFALYFCWQEGYVEDDFVKYHPATLKKLSGLGDYLKTNSASLEKVAKKDRRKVAGIRMVSTLFPDWESPKTLTRAGNYRGGVDDEADAILLCLAYVNDKSSI